MRRITITLFIVMLLAMAFPVSASALEIGELQEVYTAGEVIVVDITDDGPIDAADYTINITKPNGEGVVIAPRQTGRTAENECFETYTIEMIGDYTVEVVAADGDSAKTTFTAKLFARNSIIFMILAVVVFLVTLTIALRQMKREKEAKKA